MAKRIMAVIGINGQVELLPDRVVIHRQGLFNALQFGFNAKREIPLSAISEVMFRPASFGMGTIEFVRSGTSADDKKNAKHSTVTFNRKQTEQFEALKEKVFELINQYSRKP